MTTARSTDLSTLFGVKAPPADLWARDLILDAGFGMTISADLAAAVAPDCAALGKRLAALNAVRNDAQPLRALLRLVPDAQAFQIETAAGPRVTFVIVGDRVWIEGPRSRRIQRVAKSDALAAIYAAYPDNHGIAA